MNCSIEMALQQAAHRLALHKSPSSRIDATVLLSHLLEKPSSYLYTWPDKILTNEQIETFDALIQRREKGEPIAYIIGYRDFWSLRLFVEPSTLIPRPDTELLVELGLSLLSPNATSLLDLGTGTGAIALAMASELPLLDVTGVDFRPEAVLLAKRNQQANKITNADFLVSNWFDALEDKRYSMILSNPPYIDPLDPHLAQGDLRFEPKTALIADEHGLADIRHICHSSVNFLEKDGYLLIEHGYNQGSQVREIFKAAGFLSVETKKDYAEQDRVTLGQYIR
jgi:release factor glutamine methyltransferase